MKWNIAKSDQYICTEIKYKHTDVPCRFFFCISINCSDIQLFMCFSLLNWVRFLQKTLHLNKFIMNMIFTPRKWNIHKTQRFLVKKNPLRCALWLCNRIFRLILNPETWRGAQLLIILYITLFTLSMQLRDGCYPCCRDKYSFYRNNKPIFL